MTTAINEPLLRTNITVTGLAESSIVIRDDLWNISCALIPSDEVASYFTSPGDVETNVFTLLPRNTFSTIVAGEFAGGVSSFY